MAIPFSRCIIIPRIQLPPNIAPNIPATSIVRPSIRGATPYIMRVIAIVPASPPMIAFHGRVLTASLLGAVAQNPIGPPMTGRIDEMLVPLTSAETDRAWKFCIVGVHPTGEDSPFRFLPREYSKVEMHRTYPSS